MSSVGFELTYRSLADRLLYAGEVDVGEWHAQKVDNPLLVTREISNVVVKYWVEPTQEQIAGAIKPNLPFAEAQFQDRVSGEPLNPPPSSALWPYAQRGHEDHLQEGKFSHTYPERFWPKDARSEADEGRVIEQYCGWGIREQYGDLNDVVNQLVRNPYTRQAYLPVFFPEDTGNVSNVRVPCTLGYHFLFRKGKLSITYFIRSVDFLRHFRDDAYMACRLCQWVCEQINDATDGNFYRTQLEPDEEGEPFFGSAIPGTLTMHIVSLHCMEGDLPKLRRELDA